MAKSLSPLWQEGLLLFRCSIFGAIIAGVCLLLWYGRAKAKEFIELKLLPSVCSVLSEHIQREVDFGKVRRISPLSITLESCSIGPHSEEFSCGEAPTIKLRIHPFTSLRRGKVVFDAVLSRPTLLVAQKKDFTWLGIPYTDGSPPKHHSTEEGIDFRTRTRRVAREEAAARWERERDDGARQAAQMGYIVPDHGASLSGASGEESSNDLVESASTKSLVCLDGGMHWGDHHSMDTGTGYDVKHEDLEKSFGVDMSRSRLRSFSEIVPGPLMPNFKRKANGKDSSESSLAAKKRVLGRSAAAAAKYFEHLQHVQLNESQNSVVDFEIANLDGLVIGDVVQANATMYSEIVGANVEESAESGSPEMSYDHSSSSHSGGDVGQSNLSMSVDEQIINEATSNLSHSASSQGDHAEVGSDITQHTGNFDAVRKMVGLDENSEVLEGFETMNADRSSIDRSSQENRMLDFPRGLSEVPGDSVCSDRPTVEQKLSPARHSNESGPFSTRSIDERFSYFVTGQFQKLNKGMGHKLEDMATQTFEEADDVPAAGIDRALPVTLDSVYFKGGTLMLLAYGDAEPRFSFFLL